MGDYSFKRGDFIRLTVHRPGIKSIYIKGIVRWVSRDTINKMSHIGIQFAAFGNLKMHNSYDILKQLRFYTHRYNED